MLIMLNKFELFIVRTRYFIAMLLILNTLFVNGQSLERSFVPQAITTTDDANPELKLKATQFISQQKQLGFEENKGQIADATGNPATDVLFLAKAPGLNIWITTTGLTYQFLKEEEDGENERNNADKANEPQKENRVWHRVDMVLKGATIKSENISKDGDITNNEVNYYLGHCPYGIFNVKTYTSVLIKNIYKGIDWKIYTSKEGGLKHDFIIHPGADPAQVKLIYEGSGIFHVENNRINFKNQIGQLTEGELMCYQENEANVINSKYVLKENKHFTFSGTGISVSENNHGTTSLHCTKKSKNFSYELGLLIGNYDHSKILVIDPQLVWSTIIVGGNGADGTMAVDCDINGNVFIVGYTDASVFPTINPGAGAYYQGAKGGGVNDVFILKFSNTGAWLWSTYYGGSGIDNTNAITCDLSGNIFITGSTQSTDFPTYNNPAPAYTGAYYQGTIGATGYDAYILKFSNTGSRLWATYYGGATNFTSDQGSGITCDASGNVYVTGSTSAADFPVMGAFQPVKSGFQDMFILKFSNTMQRQWATFYGGASSEIGCSISCDPSSNVFITGYTSGISTGFPVLSPGGGAYIQATGSGFDDAFIVKFSSAGIPIWATPYGGSGTDHGQSIACDATGNVFVGGFTCSSDLPVLDPGNGTHFQGAYGGPAGINRMDGDAFVLKFSNMGVLLWGSYYGGSGVEYKAYNSDFDNLVIDKCGNVYISFETTSNNLTTQGSCGAYLDASYSTGEDIFIVKFNNDGIRLWATYWGGNVSDQRKSLAVDPNNNLYITGEWRAGTFNGSTYPFVNPGGGAFYKTTHLGGDESYLAKFIPVSPPTLTQSQANASGCGNCNGSATVTVNCGLQNYSYTWSTGSITTNVTSSTNTIPGLCPGSYTVTATSNCNQTQTATFVIAGGSSSLTTGITGTTTICTGSTTTLTASGGSFYTWSSGHSGQTATGLSAGNYTVTVTDAGGCTGTTSATIISTPPLFGQFTKGTSSCSGCGCKEWIMINAAGGTSPYSYSWPDGYVNRYKNQLCPGSYSINIKDKNGCSVNVNLITP